jgi:flagellar FliL protein
MSGKPKTEDAPPKKKGGKLIVVLALILLLGAGGFFAMKARGGDGPPKPPPPELGTIEPVAEFLVNLADGRTYLKAELAVHLDKNFDKAQLASAMPAVKDAVVARLRSMTPRQIASESGMQELRRALANDINDVLRSLQPESERTAPAGADADGGKGQEGDKNGKEGAGPARDKNPDWDSQEGPVLKIYFPSFATQRG